jgi:excisionase family DNA binding protein
MPPRFLSIRAFCDRYSVSRAHAYRLLARGELTAVKMGDKPLIPFEVAEAWADQLAPAVYTAVA